MINREIPMLASQKKTRSSATNFGIHAQERRGGKGGATGGSCKAGSESMFGTADKCSVV